jgi:4-amino-4-deoxy-L-arabinose transferase-like glycosyltransferase
VSQSAADSDEVLSGVVITRGDPAFGGATATAAPGDSREPGSSGDSDDGRRGGLAGRLVQALPLLVILLAQAIVSGRLAWVNSVFGDEATYLTQGRVEWQHWLSGGLAPSGWTDSGAPQVYPPIGAAVAALGGVTLARLLSVALMLGATILLYLAARRLFGRTAALWAAALGTLNEPVLRLAFATYDPLAIVLLMAGFYLAVRSVTARRGGELVAAAGVCLLLAGLVAVSYVIYVPFVAAVMVCARARRRSWGAAFVPAVWQVVLIGALAVIGVSQLHVWSDFVSTTVARTSGLTGTTSGIFSSAWTYGGLLACVAAAGVVAAFAVSPAGDRGRWRSPDGWLALVLALACVVVPAYQILIGTAYSMDKHMAPGLYLAAIAGGYALSRVRLEGLRPAAAYGVSAVLLAFPLYQGASAADSVFRQWPDTRPLAAALNGILTAARTSAGGSPGSAAGAGGGGSRGSFDTAGAGQLLPGPGSLLLDSRGPTDFDAWTFAYYLPDADVRIYKPSDPSFPAAIKGGLYTAAVQQLSSAALESAVSREDAVSRDGLTPAVRQAILAADTQDKDGMAAALAASHDYTITTVLPYTTSAGTDPAGVFVIWTRNH